MQASHLQINKIANLSLHHGILCLHIVCCCSDRYMEAINQCQIQYCGLVVYTLYCNIILRKIVLNLCTLNLFQYDIIDILIVSLSVFYFCQVQLYLVELFYFRKIFSISSFVCVARFSKLGIYPHANLFQDVLQCTVYIYTFSSPCFPMYNVS